MTLDEQIEQVQQDIVLLETETPVNPRCRACRSDPSCKTCGTEGDWR